MADNELNERLNKLEELVAENAKKTKEFQERLLEINERMQRMPRIIIEHVNIDDVLYSEQFGKDKYNVCNLFTEIPENYHENLRKTYAPHWIELKGNYKKISIDLDEFSWIRECAKFGRYVSEYDEQLEFTLEKIGDCQELFPPEGVFVRTDSCSLKYAPHGNAPYTSLEQVLKSLVSCPSDHSPIKANTNIINLYIFPWKKLDESLEFRVFVYKNRITAISQQHIYKTNKKLNKYREIDENYDSDNDSDSTNDYIVDIVSDINNFYHDFIRPNITHIDTYTMDIALISIAYNDTLRDEIKNDKSDSKLMQFYKRFIDYDTVRFLPYFIELNSFGAKSAAGSALFHWQNDHDKLCNSRNVIYFRYD